MRTRGPLNDEKSRRALAIPEGCELLLPFDGGIPLSVKFAAWIVSGKRELGPVEVDRDVGVRDETMQNMRMRIIGALDEPFVSKTDRKERMGLPVNIMGRQRRNKTGLARDSSERGRQWLLDKPSVCDNDSCQSIRI
jgi:hypothetical protein